MTTQEYYGFGMALLNESAGEAIHADFAKHYQGYAVKDQESDSYQRKLLHAVKTYNSNQGRMAWGRLVGTYTSERKRKRDRQTDRETEKDRER